MCTYLSKRGATYYFRRTIPLELRSAFEGRGVFMVSLRTKDRDEAKRQIPAHTMASERQLETARADLAKSTECGPAASRRFTEHYSAIEQAVRKHEREAAEFDAREMAQQDGRREARQRHRDLLERRMQLTTQQLEPWEAAIKDLLRDKDFDLQIAYDKLAYYSVRLREAEAARDHEVILSPPEQGAEPLPKTSVEAGAGVMLDSVIVDLWAAERQARQKTIDAHRAVARWFYERVGTISVEQITRKHVLAFKDALFAERQSPANINVKLSRLRTLLNWARYNDYASSNPADGIRVKDSVAAKDKRKPFDLVALNSIFTSPVFAMGARPVQGRGEAAYWLPLLALYTAARLEELGQLRASDLQWREYPDEEGKVQGAWFFNIVEAVEDGLHLKNANSERLVPVHPELERLGFISYVQDLTDKGGRVFPDLRPNKYGTLTAKWGEWFGKYRRDVCGITDKRMTFHSFRHTFKDNARHFGIVEGVQRQIMGHRSENVADDYGSGYSLHQLVEGMKRYKVPGLQALATSNTEQESASASEMDS